MLGSYKDKGKTLGSLSTGFMGVAWAYLRLLVLLFWCPGIYADGALSRFSV